VGYRLPVASFKSPPVGEVSFGLGFSPLTAFKVAHYGAYWDVIRKDYPECEDKPQVFDSTSSAISLGEWFPPPRVWYLHRDRNYLIQLQPNRIWLNWRRLNDAVEYPRFETLFPIFRQIVEQFAEFSRANNLGNIVATSGELSYVNYIPPADSKQPYSDIGDFMLDVRWAEGRKSLPNPDGIAWRAEFTMGNSKLSVDLKSGKRADTQRSLYVLEIRASNSVGTEFTANPFDWFPTANKMIVAAFCEVTTEKAQREYWHRVDY